MNYYIGTALGNRQGDKYIAESFQTISGQILKAALHNLQYNDSCRIVSDRHTVKLPLRVNWAGAGVTRLRSAVRWEVQSLMRQSV